eukprot:11703821-Alexandrium_andersonii.AAC.1
MKQSGGESATVVPWLGALGPLCRDPAPAPHTPVRGGVPPSPPGGSAASRSRTRLAGRTPRATSTPG